MRRQPTSEKLRSDRVRILPAPIAVQLRLAHDDARGPDSAKPRRDLPRPRPVSRRKTRLLAQNEEGREPLPRNVNKKTSGSMKNALLRRAETRNDDDRKDSELADADNLLPKLRRQKINSTMHYAMVKQGNAKFAHRKYIG